jgi:transposase
VLDPGRGLTKRGYFWVLARDDRPWRGGAPPAVVYSYAPGRGGDHHGRKLSDNADAISCACFGRIVNGGGKPGHMPAPEWADQRGVF